MSELTSDIRYLEGLAEGKEISEKSDEGKILFELIKKVGELSEKLDNITSRLDHMEDRMDNVEQFKDILENELEQAENFVKTFLDASLDDDEFDLDEDLFPFFDMDDDEEDDLYEVECENCGHKYMADFEDFMADEVICPKCGTAYNLTEDILSKLEEGDHDHD